MNLSNVYFVIGTSYAGKSTVVKNLAKKHGGIALEENYHDAKLPELDSREFPNLTYTRDLRDWHEFIRRTPDEYVTWLENVKKECEIVELQMIEELLDKPEAQGKKIFFAPYEPSRFYYCMCSSSLLIALRALTSSGALVILPTGSDDFIKHIADEVVYLNRDYDIESLKDFYSEQSGENWIK